MFDLQYEDAPWVGSPEREDAGADGAASGFSVDVEACGGGARHGDLRRGGQQQDEEEGGGAKDGWRSLAGAAAAVTTAVTAVLRSCPDGAVRTLTRPVRAWFVTPGP